MNESEEAQVKISTEVSVVKDHLTHNRTTEREAHELQEAARRSLLDHAAAKSLKR